LSIIRLTDHLIVDKGVIYKNFAECPAIQPAKKRNGQTNKIHPKSFFSVTDMNKYIQQKIPDR